MLFSITDASCRSAAIDSGSLEMTFEVRAGFLGKNNTVAGKPGDVVQFITARRSRLAGLEDATGRTGEEAVSPLSEVGYALRANEVEGNGEWLELWRRGITCAREQRAERELRFLGRGFRRALEPAHGFVGA